MANGIYKKCLIHAMAAVIEMQSDVKTAGKFRREAGIHFGVCNLDGIPSAEQVKKMNVFMKRKLELLPNTTFIRAWLEDIESFDEYIFHFKNSWCGDVIRIGVFNE